jgi:LPXTG-motif cell wall-anchored protein
MRAATGVVLLLVGLVWLLQGLGAPMVPESFMTENMTWVVIGAGAMLGGGGLLWWGRR